MTSCIPNSTLATVSGEPNCPQRVMETGKVKEESKSKMKVSFPRFCSLKSRKDPGEKNCLKTLARDRRVDRARSWGEEGGWTLKLKE